MQEDGTELRPWVAAHARKAIAAEGQSPKHALRQLVSWLKSTLDEKDFRTPSIDAVRFFPPYDPEDPDWRMDYQDILGEYNNVPGDSPTLPEWMPYTSEEWEEPAWVKLVEKLPESVRKTLVFPNPEPIYPDVSESLKVKFNDAKAYEGPGVPDGWDVRIVEE